LNKDSQPRGFSGFCPFLVGFGRFFGRDLSSRWA
jgi:hypothetical protein